MKRFLALIKKVMSIFKSDFEEDWKTIFQKNGGVTLYTESEFSYPKGEGETRRDVWKIVQVESRFYLLEFEPPWSFSYPRVKMYPESRFNKRQKEVRDLYKKEV